MKNFNCALIHTPKLYKENGKIFSKINFCAMGLFSLSSELEKSGYNAKIVHLGIQKYLDKSFKLSDYIKKNNIKFVAFSLQWHYQSYDVIEVARTVKQQNPDVHISLGGYTASYFAEEILKNYTFIDSIIKGEGEKPIVSLVNALSNNEPVDDVPNLYWRKNGEITLNKNLFFAQNSDLDLYEFFNAEKMLNYDTYSKVGFLLDYGKHSLNENPSESHGVTIGRGCLGNCVWCGGGFNAQKRVTGRSAISYRSSESILEEIKNLKKKHNIEIFRFSFDANPKDRTPVLQVFNAIADEFKGEITVSYNLDGLPDKEFLDTFKCAFSDKSILLLSPVFADEALRKKYKSFYYTNAQLEEMLDYMEVLGIKSEIYFSTMPQIPQEENEKSKAYGEKLKLKYKNLLNVYEYPVDIEPASPWTLCPEKYGLKDIKMTFEDYYKENTEIEKSFEADF